MCTFILHDISKAICIIIDSCSFVSFLFFSSFYALCSNILYIFLASSIYVFSSNLSSYLFFFLSNKDLYVARKGCCCFYFNTPARYSAGRRIQLFRINVNVERRWQRKGCMGHVLFAQSRPFYDYVHSGGGSMTHLHGTPAYPNYYGNSSPGQKYLRQDRSSDNRRIPGYNNYGYHSEMREVNNSYTIPQVCIEDADVRFFLFFVHFLSFFV